MSIEFVTKVAVKLDGKTVGSIKPVKMNSGVYVWEYFPKGATVGGIPYPSLITCQNSLKGWRRE